LTATNQQTGQAGERIALKLAERLGWQPWRTNVPIAGCEADVVCFRTRDGKREALILEVKTRRGDLPPAERVSAAQLARLRKMAKHFADQEELNGIEMAVVLVAVGGASQATRWLDVSAF
jgi:Holliday junction resolvase-like predicted endonuclease